MEARASLLEFYWTECVWLDCRFDTGRKSSGDKVADERRKLKHQYKKEMKATIREVKKDSAFLASQNIREKIKRYVSSPRASIHLQVSSHVVHILHRLIQYKLIYRYY